jgi:hypothetical protein
MNKKYWILFLLVMLSACNSDTIWDYKFIESDKYSISKFFSEINEYPYVADNKKISKIYDGYESLKIGLSKNEAINFLGEPDFEEFAYKYPDEKNIISSSFGYYLKRVKKELATVEEDKMLFLTFNPKGELFWVHSDNMGLKDIGGPKGSRELRNMPGPGLES